MRFIWRFCLPFGAIWVGGWAIYFIARGWL
jgi:hypothetical protein